MNCPQCQQELNVAQGSACPNCGYTPQAIQQIAMPVITPVRGKQPVKLHITVVVDRTGSLAAVKRGVEYVVEKIMEFAGMRIQTVVADLSTHGDLEWNEQPMVLVQNDKPERVVSEIKNLVLDGGLDVHETHLDSIQFALDNSTWEADPLARNMMVCFFTDETKDHRAGKTIMQLADEIKVKRIKLVLVCQRTPRLQELERAANAQLIEISNSPDDSEIQKVVAILCKTLTVVSGTGKTMTMPAGVC